MTTPSPAEIEDMKRVREMHARRFAEERARDARRLAAYQAECLASWADHLTA